jgi:tripartite-type tricarboxylate transporter receptor subunit TctC
MIRRLAAAALAAVLMPGVPQAFAQAYPSGPITLVVPLAPGDATDTAARVMADALSKELNVPIVTVNKPGAGGALGTQFVVQAPKDGATITLTNNASLIYRSILEPQVASYDALTDLTPLALGMRSPSILVVGGEQPFKSFGEMVEYAKKNPGKVNFASFGQGSTPHFYVEWYRNRMGADLVHVPYKGMAQIIPALLAGEVDVTFTAMGIVLPQIAAGQLKPLAVTNPQRSQALPNVSTLSEQGLDPHLQNWFGVFAPARTPPEVIAKLNAAFVKALRDPKFQESFLKVQAYDAVGNSPQEFAAFLKQDRANAKDVVATTGVHLDDQVPTR